MSRSSCCDKTASNLCHKKRSMTKGEREQCEKEKKKRNNKEKIQSQHDDS